MDHVEGKGGLSKMPKNKLIKELEYNIEQKEELKKEVSKLENDIIKLEQPHYNNVQYVMNPEVGKKSQYQ